MTEPIDFDRLAAELQRGDAKRDVDVCRLLEFYETVGDITGPYGPVVREIAHAYSVFQIAKESFATTEGEAIRMGWLLEAGMSYVEAVRAETPEVQS